MRWLLIGTLVGALLSASQQGCLESAKHRPLSELVVIDLAGDGLCFTSSLEGVSLRFAPNPDAPRVATAWTCASRTDALLAIDHNRNGRIDAAWELPGGNNIRNGFVYLKALERRRPTSDAATSGDGRLDASDPAFRSLIVWTDQNHNGRSEDSEMESAEHAGIVALELDGVVSTDERDVHGNVVTSRGSAVVRAHGEIVQRLVATVKFARSADSR